MGAPDTIEISCYHCKNKFSAQTKLSRCKFLKLGIGARFEFSDCILLLKGECDNCKKRNAVEIKRKTIIAVRPPEEAIFEETPFEGIRYLH